MSLIDSFLPVNASKVEFSADIDHIRKELLNNLSSFANGKYYMYVYNKSTEFTLQIEPPAGETVSHVTTSEGGFLLPEEHLPLIIGVGAGILLLLFILTGVIAWKCCRPSVRERTKEYLSCERRDESQPFSGGNPTWEGSVAGVATPSTLSLGTPGMIPPPSAFACENGRYPDIMNVQPNSSFSPRDLLTGTPVQNTYVPFDTTLTFESSVPMRSLGPSTSQTCISSSCLTPVSISVSQVTDWRMQTLPSGGKMKSRVVDRNYGRKTIFEEVGLHDTSPNEALIPNYNCTLPRNYNREPVSILKARTAL